MVQLFEMLFKAIKMYAIYRFSRPFQDVPKGIQTRTAFRVLLLFSPSHSLSHVRVCVYFIAFGKCEFSSIICVFAFSVFALMVVPNIRERKFGCVCACPRVITTLYYTCTYTRLVCDDVMMAFFGAECGVVCVVSKANLTIHIVDDISNEFIGHL